MLQKRLRSKVFKSPVNSGINNYSRTITKRTLNMSYGEFTGNVTNMVNTRPLDY